MKEMPTNVDFCYLSCNYPFGVANFLAMALHQQFFPMCIIHICNMIFLAKDTQRMNFVGVPQKIVLILTPKLLPKCEKATTKGQL